MGADLARDRALVPVIRRLLGGAGARVSSVSTVTIGTNPNSFAKMEVNITTMGNLTFTGGVPYISVSALRDVTCGFLSASYVMYTMVSTHYSRMCGTLFRVGGKIIAQLYSSETLSLSSLGGRLLSISKEVVVTNSNASVAYGCVNGRVGGTRSTPMGLGCRETSSATLITFKVVGGKRAISTRRLVPMCLHLPRTRHRLGGGLKNEAG